MPRNAATIAILLALLTGLVLGQLSNAVVSHEPAPLSLPAGGGSERVRALYDGMNRYLATGEDDFLHLLAPWFQDFSEPGAEPGSSATLLSRLDHMRQSTSPPSFAIEELHQNGNLVQVRVSTGLAETFDVAGMAVETHRAPTILEFVQLQRDTIVARWSQDDLIPLVDHPLNAPLPIEEGDAVLFSISRVTLEDGAAFELPGDAPFGLLMEQGSVTVAAGATSQRLAGGDDRWIEPTGRAHITNLEPGPTAFWLVTMGIIRANYAGIDGMFEAPKQPGVTVERLVQSVPEAWPANPGKLRLRVARVALPPGTHLTASRPGMGESLVVVAGTLDASVSQGLARHRGPDNRNGPVSDRASIIAGEGIVALHDTVASYRVAGSTPATLLVLTVVPATG